jgi:hypothetical protein
MSLNGRFAVCADGKAFHAILNRVTPSTFSYPPFEFQQLEETLHTAFEFAWAEYDVAYILDPEGQCALVICVS